MKPLRKLLPALAVLTGIVLGGCAPADPPVAGSAKVAEARWAAVAHAKIDIEGGLLQLAMPRDGRVAKVLAHEGDRVVEGQIMASLDPAAARLGVAAAQATLDQATSRINALDLQIKRLEQHSKRLAEAAAAGAGEQQAADDAAAAVEQARGERAITKAEHALAKEKIAEAELELDLQDLRAPVAGEVVRRSIQQGVVVSGQTTAFVLLPDQPRIVRAQINESFIADVVVGMRAEAVDESDSRTFSLHVLRIGKVFGVDTLEDDPQLRASARTVECVLAFDDPAPENLFIGQRLTVRIAARGQQGG